MSNFINSSSVPQGDVESSDVDMTGLENEDPAGGDYRLFALLQIWGWLKSFAFIEIDIYEACMDAYSELLAEEPQPKKVDEVYTRIIKIINSRQSCEANTFFNEVFDTMMNSNPDFKKSYEDLQESPGSFRRATTIQGSKIVKPQSILSRRETFAGVPASKVPVTVTRTPMSGPEAVELRFSCRRYDSSVLRKFILRKWSIYQNCMPHTLREDVLTQFIKCNTIRSIPAIPSTEAASLAQLPIIVINQALFSGELTVAEATPVSSKIPLAVAAGGGVSCTLDANAADELLHDMAFQTAIIQHAAQAGKQTMDSVRAVRALLAPGGGSAVTRSQAKRSGGSKRRRSNKRGHSNKRSHSNKRRQ